MIAYQSPQLAALAGRFDHPAVRVMTRELSQLAHDLEQGTRVWPAVPQLPAQQGALLPEIGTIKAALGRRRWYRRLGADQRDWQSFAQVILGILDLSPDAKPPPALNEPHPATVIALRLVWGAERFAELPTVVLKPPPDSFLDKLAHLPEPARRSAPQGLDYAVAAWLDQLQPDSNQARARLPVAALRGFARVVAACRAVGQLREGLELEDCAAGYLAWARLLRADLGRLTDISSGWWSPSERQLGRHPRA